MNPKDLERPPCHNFVPQARAFMLLGEVGETHWFPDAWGVRRQYRIVANRPSEAGDIYWYHDENVIRQMESFNGWREAGYVLSILEEVR